MGFLDAAVSEWFNTRMKPNAIRVPVTFAILIFCAGYGFSQGAVTFMLTPSGAVASLGWYMPQKAEFSTARPETIKKLPPGLKSPLYAMLAFGGSDTAPGRVHVVLDEPAGGTALLFVDTNGDGDLTNDGKTEWSGYKANGFTTWNGGAFVMLGTGTAAVKVRLNMYRFDKNDPSRQAYKSTLFYYRDYLYKGPLTLGPTVYKAALSDENAVGDFRGKQIGQAGTPQSSGVMLLLDVNEDGLFEYPQEALDVRRPFKIRGATYEITDMAAMGGTFRVVPSAQVVAETLPLPDLRVGKSILSFTTTDMDGRTVRFPEDFKGKIVMLDFWATWCGPCMEEVPGLVAAYKKYSPLGFEVLGITLDSRNQTDKVRSTAREKGMAWRQVYYGGGWDAEIAKLFGVDGIPQAYLVDGDTGEILASGDPLRGDSLARIIEAALKKKRGS
jgi:thiol-disulfide isomerase/thioredoxin